MNGLTRWSDLSAASRLSAQAIFLAVLCAAPWMFGAYEFQAQWGLYAGLLLCGSLAVLAVGALAIQPRPFRECHPGVPTLILPVIGALVFGAVQLVPWPGIVPEVGELPVISRYPESTRLELAKLAFGALAFLSSVVLFDTRPAQRWLFGTLALNGAALAAFGIAQKVSWNEKLYWTWELTQGGQPFASYVNRNSAAGYLNLCLAGAVGLLIWAIARRKERFSAARDETIAGRILRVLLSIDGWQAFAGSCLVLIVAGVLASVSRSGIAAMILALSATAVVGLRTTTSEERPRRRLRTALLTLTFLIPVIGLLAWSGLLEPLRVRLTTDRVLDDARFENWADGLRAAQHYGLVGSGFGTYRYAYLSFETRATPLWFVNADNQYLEALVEGGAVGLTLVAAAVGLLCLAVWRIARVQEGEAPAEPRAPGPSTTRSATGLASAAVILLVGQLSQAVFDYGLIMPANLLTFAALCGAISASAVERGSLRGWVSLPLPALAQVVLLVLLVANGTAAFGPIARAAKAEALRPRVRRLDMPGVLSPGALQEAIRDARRAAALQPGDATLHAETADLLIHQYRMAQLDTVSGNWERTDLAGLHARASELARTGDTAGLKTLRTATAVQRSLKPARAHLLAARSACPILPRIDLRIAALAFLDSDDPRGLAEIERAVRLTPTDPEVWFSAGVLALNSRELQTGHRYWKRSLALSPKHLPAAVRRLREFSPLSEAWIEDLLPDEPELLVEIARQLAKDAPYEKLSRLVANRAEQVLQSRGNQIAEGERQRLLGVARIAGGRRAEAVRPYEEALTLAPGNAEWRLEYARLLLSLGQADAAEKQAVALVRLDPQRQEYRDLLEDALRKRRP